MMFGARFLIVGLAGVCVYGLTLRAAILIADWLPAFIGDRLALETRRSVALVRNAVLFHVCSSLCVGPGVDVQIRGGGQSTIATVVFEHTHGEGVHVSTLGSRLLQSC